MAEPHIARVMNSTNVSSAIEFHDTSEIVSLMSALIFFFCVTGGWMRSFVTMKVMMKKMKAMAANSPMVHSQPCCWLPCPKRSTNGSVSPCTTNWAMVTRMKRMVVMLVRSLMSLVITPPKEV